MGGWRDGGTLPVPRPLTHLPSRSCKNTPRVGEAEGSHQPVFIAGDGAKLRRVPRSSRNTHTVTKGASVTHEDVAASRDFLRKS